MLRPSVFISHKANDQDAESVLREILASLNGDFDIHIDGRQHQKGRVYTKQKTKETNILPDD
jgi:hypothetical protein